MHKVFNRLCAFLSSANSSATAFFQILNDNNGVGLMFETEGDTLAQIFKSEHGNAPIFKLQWNFRASERNAKLV
jgi:hypothetical protein